MKICWDNLEDFRYNKKTGKWYKNYTSYIYMDSCKICGEPYLTLKKQIGEFCSNKCFYIFNKGENNIFYGKCHSIKSKKKISDANKGKRRTKEQRKKISEYTKREKSHFWKGGVSKNNIPLYDTYAHQIDYAEEVRRNKEDENILEVKCTYCGEWYVPKATMVRVRIQALNNTTDGEHRFYCSNDCKQECSIFNQKKYPKGFKIDTSREVQPELRKMVFSRDNYTCVECGSNKSLHCHHKEGIFWEPIESADMDMCMTVCKKCHKKIHKKEGCKYLDMKCEGGD